MLSACVGKIEEATAPSTTQFVSDPLLFGYTGIVTANPVAHDKIEITFQKVNGSPLDYVYKLYVNDSEVGIEMSLSSLTNHLSGRYYFLITDLTINTDYKFKVRAFNKKTGAQSKDEISLESKTMNNVVADFKGIINLQNVPGQESRAIRVKWDKVPYFVASPSKPNDPVKYEVIYATGSAAELFNPLSPHRHVKTISPVTVSNHPTERDIDDLIPDTTYYFSVRSVHRIYSNYENAGAPYIPVDRENNTKFLSLKTAEAEGAPGFNGSKFDVSNTLSDSGYTEVDATWARSWGSFYAFKIIYKKSNLDFIEQDYVDIPLKASDAVSGIVTITDPFITRHTVSGLTTNATYQFKLLLCKSASSSCTISGSGSNVADRSNTKSIVIKPSLASFMGLNSISHPDSASTLNQITLNFDPPVTSVGWADGMKFYCVGDNGTQHVLGTVAISSATNGGVCNGLTRGAIPGDVSTMNKLTVNGVLLGGTEYCFTATPFLLNNTGVGPIDAQLNEGQRIQRCITPEIKTPTIQQFSGLKTIAVNTNRSLTTTWINPTGGIYDRFVVFWKKREETSSTSTFSFNQAVSEYQQTFSGNSGTRKTNCGNTNYCFETLLTGNTHTTQTNLETGVHEVGILSLVTSLSGGTTNFFWSQINVEVKSAEILPSKAQFKGWTRIFAIGPKRSTQYSGSSSQYIIEAIESNGVPYEPGNNLVSAFFQPPGQPLSLTPESAATTDNSNDDAINLNSAAFDGAKNLVPYGSNSGIVSLAWEDVNFDFPSDNSSFITPQVDTASRNSTSRKNGYRIFRSDDNRISWTDITSGAYLVHSRNFTYRARPNSASTTVRMAFFTDYTVQNLEAVESSDHLKNGTEQARVYWYKIVPYFNGKTVSYTNPNAAVVRVTLPPPNMALVHRWMANRSQCLELGLPVRIDKDYSCVFTGVGATQENYPFNPGATKVDLKSDLLVDRYELGCNFSRGPSTIAAQETLKDTSFNNLSTLNSTISGNSGCYKYVDPSYSLSSNQLNPLPGLISGIANSPTAEATLKSKLLIGDCIGESFDNNTPRRWCNQDEKSRGGIGAENIALPGFAPTSGDPSTLPDGCDSFYQSKRVGIQHPSDITGLGVYPIPGDRFSWLKQNAAQSGFLNVYHNSRANGLSMPEYLVGVSGSNPTILSATPPEPVRGYASSCSINLAAIDGSNSTEMIPRWANLNQLTGSYDSSITLDKSPEEIRTNTKLYGGGVFTAPNKPSYVPNLPLGRIMTTNNAGAPPALLVDRPVASKVCELYKVNVMVVKPDKTPSIIASNLPKRLLRRREFIASNMWPETFKQDEVDYLEGVTENYNTSAALLPLQTTLKTRCAHSASGGSDSNRWTTFPDQLTGHPYFSGSKSTANCISRYGIQDLIGNMEEMSNEKLFCGYSPIGVRYGAINNSTWDDHFTSSEVNPIYDSNGGPDKAHVDLSLVATTWNDHWYLLKKGWKNGAWEYFKILKNNGSLVSDGEFNNTDLFKPYILDDDGAGYCSMIDDEVTRRASSAAVFTGNDIYKDLFFKTLNQLLIPKSSEITDKGSLTHFRDGDGFFLDFGPNHMATALLNKNSLSFPWKFSGSSGDLTRIQNYGLGSGVEYTNNVFFSSLLGIPLSCGSSSAPDFNTRCPDNQEKRLIEEHSDYWYETILERGTDFPGNVDKTFYVGGSEIQNDGLRELNVTSRTVTPPQPGAGANTNNFSIITGVKLGPSADQNTILVSVPNISSGQVTTLNQQLQYYDNTYDVEYWDVRWQLPRQTTLYFTQGGHYNKPTRVDQHNGRFSTQIGRSYIPQTGIRCAVSINEVD